MNFSRVTIRVEGKAGETMDFGPNPAMEQDNIAAEATYDRMMPTNKKGSGPTTTGKNRKGLVQQSRSD